MGIFGGYSETKVKPMLKMAVSRFNMASNKKTALMKQQMREISKLLKENKEEKARIRAEALIRDDGTIEAYEILQLTCELLFERIKLITVSKDVPDDLKSSISTLIWASNRVDIKELIDIRKQFKSKYGKQFDMDAFENRGGICNERVVAKLAVTPPTAFLVQTYLEKIADEFDVDWKPANKLTAEQMSEPMAAPVGYSVQVAPGTGLVSPVPAYPQGADAASAVSELEEPSTSAASLPQPAKASASVASVDSDTKSKDDDIPVAKVVQEEDEFYIPPAPGAGNNDNDKKPPADDFDDLQARFNNLKR
jgi:vacuolar protein sorting-associated protein IST1